MSQNSIANVTTASTGNAIATLTFNGNGSNAVTTLNMGLNTVSGLTTTSGTTATLAHSGTATTTIGTLNMAVNSAATSAGVTTAASTINLSGGTLNVTNLSMGNTTVFASNVVTNIINITGGTVNMGGKIVYTDGVGTENTTLTLNGGTLNMGGNSIGSAAVPVGSGSGALNFQAGTLMNLAELNGGAILNKTTAGVLILEGTNTYTGITQITLGTLQVGSGSTTGTLGSGNATNNSILSFNRSNAYAVSNIISGATGVVNQNGTGTTTLSGINTYGGATNVNSGILAINGDQTAATGTVTVANNATLRGTGIVGGAVNVSSGGKIRGGNSIGTLNVNNNVSILDPGGIIETEVTTGDPAGPATVTSSVLNLTGATSVLNLGVNVLNPPGTGMFTINLINDGTLYNGSVGDLGSSTALVASVATGGNIQQNGTSRVGYTFTYGTDYIVTFSGFASLDTSVSKMILQTDATGQNLYLTYTAVPEPHHILLVCVALLAAGCYARRRLFRPEMA